ncbi:class I SAM-dependent methyltransferase [soil metagenome]
MNSKTAQDETQAVNPADSRSDLERKHEIAERFGKHAESYANNPGHAKSDDLAIVLDLLKPQADWHVLDVATGGGHMAALVAPHVTSVVASDLSPGMLTAATKVFAAKGLTNVSTALTDVETLAFADDTFDAVTCRIAPHHFLNIEKAVAEMARVLKPGGVLLIEDNIAPQAARLDRFINTLEVLRDRTHVRSYTNREWREMVRAAGFNVTRTLGYRKKHDVADWIGRSDLSADELAKLNIFFLAAPKWARQHFLIEYADDRAVAFSDEKIILKAIKR